MEKEIVKITRADILKRNRDKEEKKRLKEEAVLKRLRAEAEPAPCVETIEVIVAEQRTVSTEQRTVSIAVPGSILDNAQSHELRTYLAGQVARAACIFQVDEIIVYDDLGSSASSKKEQVDDDHGVKLVRRCCAQLARILQFLECPQYLRKHFFPFHDDLSYAGLLNPLDAPHHLRQTDHFTYREGIVTARTAKPGHSLVNVGLLKEVRVKKELTPGLRVTVELTPLKEGSKKLYGEVVAPTAPRVATGVYWGYTVRIAHTLSDVLCKGPHPGGYDVTVGTSDKGTLVDDLQDGSLSQYKHMLVVFGAVQGLEAVLEDDDKLAVDDAALLFDHYLNTCPGQGSRTIRTEEAILVSLAVLRPKFSSSHSDCFKHIVPG